jgi:hypothetical protein
MIFFLGAIKSPVLVGAILSFDLPILPSLCASVTVFAFDAYICHMKKMLIMLC